MFPAGARHVFPPETVITEADSPLRTAKDKRASHEERRINSRILRRVRRTLSHRQIARRLDKAPELGVRHQMFIHPEAIHGHAVNRPLLGVEVIRTHAECAAGNPGHMM